MPLSLNFDVQISDVSLGILVGVGTSCCVAVARRLAFVQRPSIMSKVHRATDMATGTRDSPIAARIRFSTRVSEM